MCITIRLYINVSDKLCNLKLFLPKTLLPEEKRIAFLSAVSGNIMEKAAKYKKEYCITKVMLISRHSWVNELSIQRPI